MRTGTHGSGGGLDGKGGAAGRRHVVAAARCMLRTAVCVGGVLLLLQLLCGEHVALVSAARRGRKIIDQQRVAPPEIPQAILKLKEEQEGQETGVEDVKAPNVFEVNGEQLLLPEVLPNLKFTDHVDFLPDGDASEAALRDSRVWGRLYMEGWPQPVQYFRALFGGPPASGRKKLVLVEPRTACGEIVNVDALDEDTIAVAMRGECTFTEKARNVEMQTEATTLVIINNEEGLQHMPGPDGHNLDISANLIPEEDGMQLRHFLEDLHSSGVAPAQGHMIPINCGPATAEHTTRLSRKDGRGQSCFASTAADRALVEELPYGGYVARSGASRDERIEFLLGMFGSSIHPERQLGLAVAEPEDACHSLAEQEDQIKGKAVLVKRGGCTFVAKAANVQSAGGSMMVVVSRDATLQRAGAEPRWEALSVQIPVIMVSQRGAELLREASENGESMLARFNAEVDANAWEHLSGLVIGDGWPRRGDEQEEHARELLEQHAAFPDRVEAIKQGFAVTGGNRDEL